MTEIDNMRDKFLPSAVRAIVAPLETTIEQLHRENEELAELVKQSVIQTQIEDTEVDELQVLVDQLKGERDGVRGKHIEEMTALRRDLDEQETRIVEKSKYYSEIIEQLQCERDEFAATGLSTQELLTEALVSEARLTKAIEDVLKLLETPFGISIKWKMLEILNEAIKDK